MEFRRYLSVEEFSSDVLGPLLKNEAENNLLISMLTESKSKGSADWLMAAIVDDGSVALAALCTKPFNLLLYEPENCREGAVELLAFGIRRIGFDLPGVLAERGLANRFSEAYRADGSGRRHMTMIVMRLDKLADYKNAPGGFRVLDERDMFFVPFWEHAFGSDCRVYEFPLPEIVERVRTRLGKGTHFIWEDGPPVSQAVHGRNTPNGAIINMVYTPPHYRGRGYATSVVGELSRSLLAKGKAFCALYVDADNPISRKVYQKLGYYDVCAFDEIRF